MPNLLNMVTVYGSAVSLDNQLPSLCSARNLNVFTSGMSETIKKDPTLYCKCIMHQAV